MRPLLGVEEKAPEKVKQIIKDQTLSVLNILTNQNDIKAIFIATRGSLYWAREPPQKIFLGFQKMSKDDYIESLKDTVKYYMRLVKRSSLFQKYRWFQMNL